MQDRQPKDPGRIKFTLDDGTVLNGVLERNDNPEVEGTALNKANLFDDDAESRYGVETPSEAMNLIGRDVDVTVSVSGWSTSVDSDGYYTNQVTVSGMSAAHTPIFGLAPVAATAIEAAKGAFSVIERMTTADGYVVFKATEIPESDVVIRIKGV